MAQAMGKIGGGPRDPVVLSLSHIKSGKYVKNEVVKKLITPTPEERALGIMPKDKAELLKKLGNERNPLFLTLDKIQYAYGLRLLIAEYYLSYLTKMNALLNPVDSEGKPKKLTPEETVKIERSLDYDRRKIFEMSKEAGEFLFGKEPTTSITMQQLQIQENKVNFTEVFEKLVLDKLKKSENKEDAE